MRRANRNELVLCAVVMATSFALAYAGYSAATQFGDGNNCGPGTNGSSGSDTYLMGAGNDCAAMQAGNDYLDGQGGGDQAATGLIGNDGYDTIYGGGGCDVIGGSPGNDYEDGQDDCDLISDTAGADIFRGGAGGDDIFARDGWANDDIQGGAGDDFCSFDLGDQISGCEAAVH